MGLQRDSAFHIMFKEKKGGEKKDVSSLALIRERDEKNTDVQMPKCKKQAHSSELELVD